MTTPQQDDAFAADIRKDLDRVDAVMTHVIKDPATRDEFIRDPSGVLTRLGLHPRTTRAIHDRCNKIFYAVLQNAELVRYVQENLVNFSAANEQSLADHAGAVERGLRRGAVDHSADADMAAADHVFRNPDIMRRIYRLTLADLNNRRLLENVYTTDQINAYVDDLVAAVQERRPIRALPKLERWDANYGVGTGYGVGEAEVGPVVTVGVFVEVGIAISVVIPVFVLGLAMRDDVISSAAQGDPEAVQAVATAGSILQLAGEMLVHAHTFERG